jgi:hypothetical protein
MKKTIVVAVGILCSLPAFAQNKNYLDQPYLETNAVVDTLVVPDRIYLSILITEADTKGKTSVEELENKMAAKFKALGIDTKKQLTLADVATNFKNYFLKKTDVLKSKAYTLLVYDAQTAGKVIVGLESIDIANVQLTKTEYSKMEALQTALVGQAVAKAKLQAEAMLRPLGQNLGKALYLSDLSTNRYLQGKTAGILVRGMAMDEAQHYDPIDISFEKIEIQGSVNVIFAIE